MLSSSFTRISGHGDFKVNVFMFLLFLRNKIKNKKMLPDCGKITHGPDALSFFVFLLLLVGHSFRDEPSFPVVRFFCSSSTEFKWSHALKAE